jgi:hypothetical protein
VRGLRHLPYDSRLQIALGRLATRRHPILSFLPRTHILNRGLGRLRHRILQFVPQRKQLVPSELDA